MEVFEKVLIGLIDEFFSGIVGNEHIYVCWKSEISMIKNYQIYKKCRLAKKNFFLNFVS